MLGVIGFKKSVGLEIADRTIEVAELVKKGQKPKVLNLGRVRLAPGIVERGRIKDEKELTKAVKEAFANARPNPIRAKSVIFGLPESQVYVRFLELTPHAKFGFDKLTTIEKRELILGEAQKSIPLAGEDLLFSYQTLYEEEDKLVILLVAISKQVFTEWESFFKKIKLKVEVFDIESLAVLRSLFESSLKNLVCVVDIGSTATNIIIVDSQGLRYCRTFGIAGEVLTQEIARSLKITRAKAEKQKIKIGLTNKSSRVFSILVKKLELLVREIEAVVNFFQEKSKQKIERVILVGGSSKLKGITDYLEANLDLPVKLGKSVLLKKKASLEYLEAIGLALRGLDKKWSFKDPAIAAQRTFSEGQRLKKKLPRLKTQVAKDESGRLSSSFFNQGQARRLKVQKSLLVFILIIGTLLIGLAYWYRHKEKAKQQEELASQAIQYTQVQVFNLQIPVATDMIEYRPDRVEGRIIEETIKGAGSYEEAIAHSRIAAEKELKEEEILWPEPVNISSRQEPVSFPLTISWLAYSKEVDQLFLKKVEQLNKEKIDYVLNKIEVKDLKLTANSHLFSLFAEVTISLNQLIRLKEGEEVQPDRSDEGEAGVEVRVLIKETETGWLRVREGPGIDYPEITRIYPQESYPLLEESDEWYKIELEEGRYGWISERYATKQ